MGFSRENTLGAALMGVLWSFQATFAVFQKESGGFFFEDKRTIERSLTQINPDTCLI